MNFNRRKFLKTSFALGALSSLNMKFPESKIFAQGKDKVDEALKNPVFKKFYFKSPVIIESIQLMEYKKNYVLLVRSKDGAVGYSVSNNRHMEYMYPILQQRVATYFIGKDARDLDELVDGVFLYESNYKLQGLRVMDSFGNCRIRNS